MITHADEITGKKGEALRAHLGDVIRNRRLNALVCDLELELAPAELAVRPWDRQEVHNLFDSLEFQVLRNRLFESLTSEEDIEEGGFELAGATLEEGGVAAWLAEAGTQTVGDPRPRLLGRPAPAASRGSRSRPAPAWRPTSTSRGWVPPTTRRSATGSPTRPDRRCSTTPRGRAWRWLPTAGPWPGVQSDTALAAYLVRPDQRSYDLADLTLRYLRRELKQEAADEDQGALFDEGADVANTAMLHARAVLDLAEALDAAIEEHGGGRLLAEIELPLIDLLKTMEQTGIAVDADHLEIAGEPLRRRGEAGGRRRPSP